MQSNDLTLLNKIDHAIGKQKETNDSIDRIKNQLSDMKERQLSLKNHFQRLESKVDFYLEIANSKDVKILTCISNLFYFVLGLSIGYLMYLYNR